MAKLDLILKNLMIGRKVTISQLIETKYKNLIIKYLYFYELT